MPLLLIIVAAAFVIGGIIIAAAGSKKQREGAVAAGCRQVGLLHQSKPFASKLDPRWLPFSGIGALKGGHKKVNWGAFGVIAGHEVLAIEHKYVVSTGQVTAVITHTCIACRCPGFWPEIELRPENVLHRLADKLGSGDLEFESERFNKRWRVSASDTDLALAVLTPGVQAMLEDAPRTEVWSIGHGWVLVCRRASIKPEQLPAFLRRPIELIARVPEEMLVEVPADES